MTELSVRDRRQHLIDGLNYLRRHALDGHRAGDGMLVLNLCATALRRSQEFGKAHPEEKLQLAEVRWAFILGMHWIVYDWFLFLVRSAFEHINCDGDNATDRELLVLIHNRLHSPHDVLNKGSIAEIPEAWWRSRFGAAATECEEDVVALSFLIELVWYSSPAADEWKSLVDRWQDGCPEASAMQARVVELKGRLQYQAGMFSGGAFEPGAHISLPIEDLLQRDVFRGWNAYYNCEWIELAKIIDRLKHRVNIENPSYIPFFYLVNASRIHRPEAEDQFTSLPRLHVARSRQAAQIFLHTREAHAKEQFMAVAWAGFPRDDMGPERVACLRMAMLVQLQALRTWDVGSWLRGLRQRADSRLELGTIGRIDDAVQGVLDAVIAHYTPDDNKSPRFAQCLTLLDSLDDNGRRMVTRRLLQALPIEWRNAHKVLSVLSDAIPEDVLPEVVHWSLDVEATDLLKNHWTRTLLDVWNDILPYASRKAELSERLAPALRQVVKKPGCWEELHNTILAATLHGPISLANELVSLMFAVDCTEPHLVEWRVSVGFNLLKQRPEIGSQLVPRLRADVDATSHTYQRRLLDLHEFANSENLEEADRDFRQMIRDDLLRRITERQNLAGPSIEIGGSTFHYLARLVSWATPDAELVDSVVSAIESETVLYGDKVDYLAFLAELVKSGPTEQAESIATHAVRWLADGIPGRSVGPNIGGPLSSAQLFLTGPESLKEPLFFLIEQSAIRCAEAVLPTLMGWLSLNAPQHVHKHAYCLLGTCFALCTAASQDSEESAAILVGLSESISLLSLATEATDAVLSFDSVILQSRIAEITGAIAEKQLWCQTLLKQWEHRLKSLAEHPNVKVRQCVANAVRHWIESGLANDEIAKIRDLLAKDCRLRVRKAISETDRV